MNMDHRRPLVAYVLVALVGAFVLAQGLAREAVEFGPGPRISALVDITRTPSERAGELEDGYDLGLAPLVTTPPEEPPFLAPSLDVVDQMVGGVDYSAEDPGTTTTAAAVDEPAAGGSPDGDGSGQVVTASELVPTPGTGGAGSSQGGADGSRSGENGSGSGGGNGGGLFGTPPSDDGPDPAGPGSEGQPSPAPHSFDDVPEHAHPYGHHVGPKPGKPDQAGQGKPDQAGQGKPDQAGQGKGKDKDKDAKGQGKGNKGAKGQGNKGGKATNGKGGEGKGHGKRTSKAHAPGWVKGGPR